jgi:unsaturated rhamnogalacturonyl hydrolase
VGMLGSNAPINCAMIGEPLLHASQATGDPALKAASDELLDYFLKRARRAPDGTLYHSGQSMIADGLDCMTPYLAVAGHFDEALQQIEGLRKRLWNPEKRLFSHRWDEAAQALRRPAFWGGGSGWAAVGFTRVIRALPPERQADKDRLLGYLKDVLDGCLVYQRPDGLFHDILDQPSSFVEVTAGEMLAYSIYCGIRGGWLPADYRAAADRTRQVARAKVDRYGFVRDTCGAPGFGQPGISPEGQAFFVLMETAARQLESAAGGA